MHFYFLYNKFMDLHYLGSKLIEMSGSLPDITLFRGYPMHIDQNNHLDPIFGWTMDNRTRVSIAAKSKAGFEYIIPTTNVERIPDGGMVAITVELKNVYMDRIVFRPNEATTRLDRALMTALALRKQEMDNNKLLDRKLRLTISTKLVIKADHVEDDHGVHSDLLGVSFFMDTEVGAPVGVPKGTPAAINHRLTWDTPKKEESVVGYETRLTVLYNDPANIFEGLWMNVLGKARSLQKLVLHTTPPGLYITYRKGTSVTERVDKYYSFDELTDKVLEELGLFKSRDTALKGGNTERYLKAEADLSAQRKESARLGERITSLKYELNKEEGSVARLTNEVTHLKQLNALKTQEQKLAIETMKHNAKPSGTAAFMDFCKGVGLLAGTVSTTYKLFYSR